MSHVVRIPANTPGLELGEPLLFKAASWALWGNPPDGYALNLHPVGFAAWFGLLATALNLFPIAQLDGGHISYAVLGRRSIYITFGMMAVAIGLAYFSASWILWTALTIGMLIVFGPRHPPVFDEHVPLDRARVALAFVALLMLVLCFTPAPIRPVDVMRP
jgi:membrane-associated protease RseP (regulator of RpoE activity)